MKQAQKIQVIYRGVSFYTKKNKVYEAFDYYTAQAVEYACKAIDDHNRQNKEKIDGIVGSFGFTCPRDIQIRVLKQKENKKTSGFSQ